MTPIRLGKKPHKYKAKPVVLDGVRFDSLAEAARYWDLTILQRAGKITDLKIHPRWPIVINNIKVCVVELDFSYLDEKGQLRTEDVKGCMTALSNLKRKMIGATYGIAVNIIKRHRRR